MKKIIVFIIALLILMPSNVFALSESYNDKVAKIVNKEAEDDKINIYLFHGAECPHCEEERSWLEKISEDYKEYVNIYYFEVWHDSNNKALLKNVKEELKIDAESVPLTIVGDSYFVGYSDAIASRIENKIQEYALLDTNPNDVNIPILGNINMKDVSVPLVAIILGLVDGFNPCAMWILLFLINMLLGVKNKKKSWILGLTFLFISALVYLLSMLGMNYILNMVSVSWLKIAIALFILIAGISNLKKYLKMRKTETGCSVVNDKKRKKLIVQIKKIINNNSFILALLGIIVLAMSINIVELACSLGFPLVFTEILSINNAVGIAKIVYLLIYIFFYMIDDMLVFAISMITFEATGITNKYNKLCTLISAVIMIAMGLLLIFKPDWLMLNF